MNLREAAQQALEALKRIKPKISEDGLHWISHDRAITALKAALEQPEQEPVAWMTHTNDLMPLVHKTRKSALNWQTQPIPLYTHPPRREWQGLTDEEAAACWSTSAVETWKAIEAALKEKNK
jgi:hypothetical protein